MNDELHQMVGRIDGKLDALISNLEAHAAEDTRRFDAVGKLLLQHSEDINQAKGAKGVIMWAAGGLAAVAGFAASYLAKVMGIHQ